MAQGSVVHVMGWRSQQYGSFERFLVALAGRCRAEGLETHLVFHGPPASAAFVRDCDAEIHTLEPPRSPLFATRLRAILAAAGATHVHAHFGADAYVTLALARGARRFATKHIVPGRSPLRHRWLAAQVEALFAVSARVRDELLALGVPPGKVEVAYLGVDAAVYRPDERRRDAARAALGLRDSERLVLSTSHLRPGKGVELLPDLAAALAQDPGAVVVALAGDGPLRAELESSGALRMLGVREDVPDLLAAADVVVFPTVGNEGLGLGPLEALATAAPLVASAVSDLPSLVDDTVTLVPPGDAGALAEACRAILDDPAPARERALRGRQLVIERLAVDRAVEAHVSRYTRPG